MTGDQYVIADTGFEGSWPLLCSFKRGWHLNFNTETLLAGIIIRKEFSTSMDLPS